MIKIIFQIFSQLPLVWLHRLGHILGYVMYFVTPKDRHLIRENLSIAGLPHDKKMVLRVCQETVKSGLELAVAFFRQPEQIVALFKQIHGWQYIQQAIDNKQGLLLITPHIGSYDLAGRYISEQLPFPLTAMYKPPKIQAFDEIMQLGRVRGKGHTAPTNLQGVKQIMKALRQGESTIVLPDHVPAPKDGGDGVWVDFFGKPAFTMTLAGKLANMKNVTTVFFVGERLPRGQGFVLHILPLSGSLNGDKHHDAMVINHNVEQLIGRFPEQYLFAYNRYKCPEGAPERPK